MTTEEWDLLAVGVYDVSEFLMYGHWLALVGDWCFVAGYVVVSSLTGRRFHAPACVSPVLWGRVGRAGLVTAVAGLALRFADRYVGFGGLDSLVGYVQSYGPAAGVYLMLLASRRGGHGGTDGFPSPRGLAYVLLGLDLADGFFSYMKSPLLVAILPLLLIRAEQGPARRQPGLGLRPFRPAVAVLLAAYFFLFVVSSYSEARRPAFWEFGAGPERADPYDVPVAPYLAPAVLGAIPGTAGVRGYASVSERGLGAGAPHVPDAVPGLDLPAGGVRRFPRRQLLREPAGARDAAHRLARQAGGVDGPRLRGGDWGGPLVRPGAQLGRHDDAGRVLLVGGLRRARFWDARQAAPRSRVRGCCSGTSSC